MQQYPATPNIKSAYNAWKIAQQKLKIITYGLRDTKRQYEAKNILERALLSEANGKPHNIVKEVIEKRICNDITAPCLIEALSLVTCSGSAPEYYTVRDCVFIYGGFQSDIPRERIELLSKNGDNAAILFCLLTYAAHVCGGQQWNIPQQVYAVLVRDFDCALECFASPLNSQLMPHGRPFCSLHPDADAAFGSIGDFFSVTIDQLEPLVNNGSLTISVNPPYTLTIMDAAADKTLELLSNSEINLCVISTWPNWFDTHYYPLLSESQYLVQKIELRRKEYYYENTMQVRPSKITAQFDSTVFILANFDIPMRDFSNIVGAFRI